MPTAQMTLEIDFGQVGYHSSKHAFKVRLDSAPLLRLVEDVRDHALRIHELLLIKRPGDVWNYVFVECIDVPPRVAQGVDGLRKKAERRHAPHPWPERRVPILEFDRLFGWCYDDTEPEDEAWLNHRESEPLRSFARSLLCIAQDGLRQASWNDHLIQHVVERTIGGEHPYCFTDRASLIKPCHIGQPITRNYTPGFYTKLRDLLRDSEISSVAFRASGDTEVLRMMATEQRRRANLTGHLAGNALHLGALVNYELSNEGWDSEIWFFSEGLSHGDLFIEGGGLGANPIKDLVEKWGRMPGRHILSFRHEGEIDGFDLVGQGDQWFWYRRTNPDSRRLSLAYIDDRRRFSKGEVLAFSKNGASVFSYEKALIFVGKSISDKSRHALGQSITHWRQLDGNPIVIEQRQAGELPPSGLPSIVLPDNEDSASQLERLLTEKCPWIDVVILLDAPDWVEGVLAQRFDRSLPWKPWFVSNRPLQSLRTDLLIEGGVAEIFTEASARADAHRPKML